MGVLDGMVLVSQLSGLHAIMLITLAAHLLRIPHCKAECAKLEECVTKLCALLQWSGPNGSDVATQLRVMAARALLEEAGLVGLYGRSTLWCRVQTARSMETQLRAMHDRVNLLCMTVLLIHANLPIDHPCRNQVIGDPLLGAETSDSTGQGGAGDQSDNTESGGFESAV